MKTIEQVSDSIINRAKFLKILVNVSKSYFDALNRYILGMNPQEHSRISSYFTQVESILPLLSEGVNKLSLPVLYGVYERFSTMDAIAADFMLLCSNQTYSRASLSEMSSGQHANMRADISRAISAYEKYLAAGVDDDDIFELAIVITKAVQTEYYTFLVQNHAPNKMTMEMIRRLLPVVIGERRLFIMELINEQKNTIIGSSRVNVGTWDIQPASVPADAVPADATDMSALTETVSASALTETVSASAIAEAIPAEVVPADATLADATLADATLADATLADATLADATPAEATHIHESASAMAQDVPARVKLSSTPASVHTAVPALNNFMHTPTRLQGHECMIFRYGLSPATVSMPIKDLFKTLEWKWDDSLGLHENFINASTRGNNIVILHRTHGTPIEFDFRGVLDKSYAEKLPVKPLSGLNKNFLARYNTSLVLTEGKDMGGTTNVTSKDTGDTINSQNSKHKWVPKPIRLYSARIDVKYPIRFIINSLNWSVLETIDGKNYRELGCTLQIITNDETNEMPRPDLKIGTYTTFIPGARILGLIMGVSTLPTEYNNLHAQNITRTRGDMFDPVAPSHISRFASYEKVIPASEPIKNEVVKRFELYIRARVDNVKSNREWQNLFTSDEFFAAANEFISGALVRSSLIDKLKSPEYTITQIARINAVVAKFIKSVTRAGEGVPERTFSEYLREELNRILIDRFVAVIKKAADLMDSDKAWTSNELTLKEFIIAY